MIMIRHSEGSSAMARFAPGELVWHRRYGYRAVVVALDLTCAAPDEWYQTNQSQPKRTQPWYHLLVDGASHTTYAAQSNLEADRSGKMIAHPLVSEFFSALENGRYIRNDRPWGS